MRNPSYKGIINRFIGTGSLVVTLLSGGPALAQVRLWTGNETVWAPAAGDVNRHAVLPFNNTAACARDADDTAHAVFIVSEIAANAGEPAATAVSYLRRALGGVWTNSSLASFFANGRVHKPTVSYLAGLSGSPDWLAIAWIETSSGASTYDHVVLTLSQDNGQTWPIRANIHSSLVAGGGAAGVMGALRGLSIDLHRDGASRPRIELCWTNEDLGASGGIHCHSGILKKGVWGFDAVDLKQVVPAALIAHTQDVSVAGDGDQAYIAFDDFVGPASSDVYVAKRASASADSWGSPVSLGTGAGPYYGNDPSLAIVPDHTVPSGKRLLLGYQTTLGGASKYGVWLRSSTDQGQSFSPATNIGSGLFAKVTGIDGRTVVAWAQTVGTVQDDSLKSPGASVSDPVFTAGGHRSDMCPGQAFCPASYASQTTACVNKSGMDVFWVDVSDSSKSELKHAFGAF